MQYYIARVKIPDDIENQSIRNSIHCILVTAEDIATTLYPYIYTNLNNWPCVRLLNATGTIGCHCKSVVIKILMVIHLLFFFFSIALKKKSGILYQTNSQQDVNDFVNNKKLSGDYVIVLPFHLLTKSILDALATTDKITGLVVLLTSTPSDTIAYSPDSTCPNCEFGLYANDTDRYSWNPKAQNLIEQNFDFPIFAIRPEDEMSNTVYDYITKVKKKKKTNTGGFLECS